MNTISRFKALIGIGLPLLVSGLATDAAPANDQFANAQILTGPAAIVAGSNVGATAQSGEPNPSGNAGGHSIWFRWTAPSNGTWAVDTIGSSFDSIVVIYTGNALNALTLIGGSDDAPGRTDGSSRAVFDAVAGVTYQISVDGFGSATGSVLLKLFPSDLALLYATGFEAFDPNSTLQGQDGWKTLGSGVNGVGNFIPGSGQQGFLGFSTGFGADTLSVWRPLNHIPTFTYPVVHFFVSLEIKASTNSHNDDFEWNFRNSELFNNFLLGLDFDNNDKNVYYRYAKSATSTAFQATGVTFTNDQVYQLNVTLDFLRQRWSATLDNRILAVEVPFATNGQLASLDMIEATWERKSAQFPGNNAMVFDNYFVTADRTATPAIAPGIALPPQNQSVSAGGSASFSVVASGVEPLRYQWLFNNSPISGQTGPLLTLSNLTAGQAGNYSIVVSNAAGTITSSASLGVVGGVNPPATLTAAKRLANGQFQFTVNGTPESRVAIEFSSDLRTWQPLGTNTLASGSATITDSTSQPQRFYRARNVQ